MGNKCQGNVSLQAWYTSATPLLAPAAASYNPLPLLTSSSRPIGSSPSFTKPPSLHDIAVRITASVPATQTTGNPILFTWGEKEYHSLAQKSSYTGSSSKPPIRTAQAAAALQHNANTWTQTHGRTSSQALDRFWLEGKSRWIRRIPSSWQLLQRRNKPRARRRWRSRRLNGVSKQCSSRFQHCGSGWRREIAMWRHYERKRRREDMKRLLGSLSMCLSLRWCWCLCWCLCWWSWLCWCGEYWHRLLLATHLLHARRDVVELRQRHRQSWPEDDAAQDGV